VKRVLSLLLETLLSLGEPLVLSYGHAELYRSGASQPTTEIGVASKRMDVEWRITCCSETRRGRGANGGYGGRGRLQLVS